MVTIYHILSRAAEDVWSRRSHSSVPLYWLFTEGLKWVEL